MIFIDTSFLLAPAIESDALHVRAQAWQEQLDVPLLTTDFILVETGNALSLPRDRPTAQFIIETVRSSAQFEIIPASRELLNIGYSLFKHRADKEWGLTDCISFEIMRERGIVDALTYDHHFEQAAFRALLRHDPPAV